MLIEFFIVMVLSFVSFVIGLFPTLALPSDMVTYIHSAYALVASLGAVIPLSTVTNILTVVISFYGIQFLFSFGNWVFRKIPTIS